MLLRRQNDKLDFAQGKKKIKHLIMATWSERCKLVSTRAESDVSLIITRQSQ